MNIEELKTRIIQYMDENNLSQEGFAKLAGVSSGTVGNLIHDRRMPTDKMLRKMDKAASLKASEVVVDLEDVTTLTGMATMAQMKIKSIDKRLGALEREKANLLVLKEQLLVLTSLKAQNTKVKNKDVNAPSSITKPVKSKTVEQENLVFDDDLDNESED